MRKIESYPIAPEEDSVFPTAVFTIEMPAAAQILEVRASAGLELVALIDTSKPVVPYHLILAGIGYELPEGGVFRRVCAMPYNKSLYLCEVFSA